MIQRLIQFYKRSGNGPSNCLSPIWSGVIASYHQDLIAAIQSEDKDNVKRILKETASGNGKFGMAWPEPCSPESSRLLELLAQRVGVLSVVNPEQRSPTSNWQINDYHGIKSKVEKELGFELFIPMDCLGWDSSQSIMPRYLFYCASAWTISRHLIPTNMLEIGAGLGVMGWIARHWNCRSYTVIDLPIIAVRSAYFMASVCGEDEIWLWGEPEKSAFAKFYPANQPLPADKKYDLVYNSDSLPEMNFEIREQYLSFIKSHLTHDGIFVSVNHESDKDNQGRVYDLSDGFRLIYRAPFMMRPGYVEEIYRV